MSVMMREYQLPVIPVHFTFDERLRFRTSSLPNQPFTLRTTLHYRAAILNSSTFKLLQEPEVVPGEYDISFHSLASDGMGWISGEELIKKAQEQGLSSSIQHAVWLLDNNQIPQDLLNSCIRRRGRGVSRRSAGYKYLIFPNSLAESVGFRAVVGIEKEGEKYQLCLRLLDGGFGSGDLVVDAKLVDASK